MAARRYVQVLRRRIGSLKLFPEGYGLAPEAEAAGVELRQMIHGVYRVLYTVDDKVVMIHAVRHGARRPLRRDELRP
jgi:plasmid stabilization system protein ParE